KNGTINVILHDKWQTNEYRDAGLPQQSHKELQFIEHAFSDFIGLHDFKHYVKEIYAMNLIQSRREELGLEASSQSLHMIFKVNSGTGKTTIARKLASVFFELQVLSKGHFFYNERSDLVVAYIRPTAITTRKKHS